MTEHSFNTDIAKKYGIHSAVLLNNIQFWTEKNKANGKHFYDGNYWTYNSRKAFTELFPYMNARQVDYALKKLIDDGVIITGNYNQKPYDRTLWYAVTKKGHSILQNCDMEITNSVNGNNKNVEPIPDINTDINTDINNILTEFDTLWDMYPRKEGKTKALKAYEKARKNGVSFEEVKQGIEAYCKQIKAKKTEREYIKHGSTWFNGECWNDEYTPAKTYGATGVEITTGPDELDGIL